MLRDKINGIRNNIVANRSEVVDEKIPDDVIEKLREEVYHPFFDVDKEISVRKIKNGNDFFYVADGVSSGNNSRRLGDPRDNDPTYFYEVMRTLSVKSNDDVCNMHIYANTLVRQGDCAPPPPKEIGIDNRIRMKLHPNTDINNINEVRYQLSDDSDMAYFIDKFIIVSPEEKESYKKYVEARQFETEQAAKKAAIEAKLQKKVLKERYKQYKINQREIKKEEKLGEKVEIAKSRKFLGR